MKPHSVGMDVEPIGNLGDGDGGVRCVDQFRNQLSPSSERCVAAFADSPRAVGRLPTAIATYPSWDHGSVFLGGREATIAVSTASGPSLLARLVISATPSGRAVCR